MINMSHLAKNLILVLHFASVTICFGNNCGTSEFNPPIASNCTEDSTSKLANTTCTLGCIEGYYFNSAIPNITICSNTGEWDPIPDPDDTCNIIVCNDSPDHVADSTVDGNCKAKDKFGTECNITCDDGYYLSAGSGKLVCDDPHPSDDSDHDGQWNTTDTDCTIMVCKDSPDHVADSTVDGSCKARDKFGTECNITCDDGYYLSAGSGKLVCDDPHPSDDSDHDGQWNTTDTVCTIMECKNSPVPVAHSTVDRNCKAGDTFGTECDLTCDEGYFLSAGAGNVVCDDPDPFDDSDETGTWNTTGTVCTAYMVLKIGPSASGVKGKDTNLTVQIESLAPYGDVGFTVIVISSPNNAVNGEHLKIASHNDGTITYFVTLFNLTESVAGNYTFNSSSTSTKTNIYPNIWSSGTQYLSIQVIPENFRFYVNATEVDSDIIYVRGDPNNTVECVAYAKPLPDYQWKNEAGHDLSGNITSEQSMLQLGDSYFSDNATYVCYANNSASDAYSEFPSRGIYVAIEGAPVMIQNTTQPIPVNDNINLTCYMDSNPEPNEVLWMNNGTNYNFASDEFANQFDIQRLVKGEYFQYENEIALFSQLCIGKQNIQCSSNNAIGQSETSIEYVINEGTYFLDVGTMTYMTESDQKVNKSSADQACSQSSGHLVYITDASIQDFLDANIGGEYYIGAVRNAEGNWMWGENGDPVEYDNFQNTSSGNCSISINSTWKAVDCTEIYRYVCELPASGFPKDVTADTAVCEPNYLQVSWQAADARFQTTEYRVVVYNTNTSFIYKNVSRTMQTLPVDFTDAEPDTQYEVKVYSAIDICLPQYTPVVVTKATTGFGKPQQVQNATMRVDDSTTLCAVQWDYNETFKWQIESYEVTITANIANTEDPTETYVKCSPGNNTNCSFKMDPNTRYSATIIAISSCGVPGNTESSGGGCISKSAAPAEVELGNGTKGGSETIDASSGIPVQVPPQDDRNGRISCMILVLTIDDSEKASESRIPNSSTLQLDDGEHIVYAYNNATSGFEFIIGNDTRSSNCHTNPTSRRKRATSQFNSTTVPAENVKLSPSKYYRYYIKTTTPVAGDVYVVQASNMSIVIVTAANPDYAWVAGVVVPIFVIIVAIAVFIYYRHRKKNEKPNPPIPLSPELPPDYSNENPVYDSIDDNPVLPPKPNRIQSRNLQGVYDYKHKDEDRLFREEFKAIKNSASQLKKNFDVAAEFKGLNRYVNILPANDASVLLSTSTTENSKGYINASYIDGYDRTMKFIATQGPKPNTLNDFWRMVWEQKTEAIVMLTNVDENGKRKCEKYWPDNNETWEFGDIIVTATSVSECGPIVIRKFSITEKKATDARIVCQYHYIAWPDHGVPVTTSDLFNLRRMVKIQHTRRDPIVVHCSAGVGRTGTFIALDCLLDDLAKTSSIDITSQVWAMRERRTEMVQTADQYALLYKMVLERHLIGETDDNVASLENDMRSDRLSDDKLEEQLENAGRLLPLETEQYVGTRPENMQFNRDRSAIPYDRNLVTMRMRPEEHSPRYINASLIQGYAKDEKFIATQDPLDGSEELFWRMVLDNNVKIIVMIKKRGEAQDISGQYWADQHTMEFGKISVSVLENFPERNMVQRKIFVKEVILTSARSSTITHFEFNGWPEDHNAGADAILELISRVQNERMSGDGKNGPVVIHCGNGSECVGTFCAITNIVERIKVENRVDVMRVVKDLRDMRPGMISTLNEYKLCYAGVQSYLSSFETYANFR